MKMQFFAYSHYHFFFWGGRAKWSPWYWKGKVYAWLWGWIPDINPLVKSPLPTKVKLGGRLNFKTHFTAQKMTKGICNLVETTNSTDLIFYILLDWYLKSCIGVDRTLAYWVIKTSFSRQICYGQSMDQIENQ